MRCPYCNEWQFKEGVWWKKPGGWWACYSCWTECKEADNGELFWFPPKGGDE